MEYTVVKLCPVECLKASDVKNGTFQGGENNSKQIRFVFWNIFGQS